MKFDPKRIKKFLTGGEIMPEETINETTIEENPSTESQSLEDPLLMIAQIFMQGLQNQDCNLLAQGAQAFLQLLQQAQLQSAPVDQGEPVFAKNGAKLVRRIRK